MSQDEMVTKAVIAASSKLFKTKKFFDLKVMQSLKRKIFSLHDCACNEDPVYQKNKSQILCYVDYSHAQNDKILVNVYPCAYIIFPMPDPFLPFLEIIEIPNCFDGFSGKILYDNLNDFREQTQNLFIPICYHILPQEPNLLSPALEVRKKIFKNVKHLIKNIHGHVIFSLMEDVPELSPYAQWRQQAQIPYWELLRKRYIPVENDTVSLLSYTLTQKELNNLQAEN